MTDRVIPQVKAPSNNGLKRYDSLALRHIGMQVEALLSRHGSLELYRRSIERQLTLLAVCLHMEDAPLLTREVFLQVEIRGSGGLQALLEQIARILGEVGYWKPSRYGQSYHPHDVYALSRSAQRLFDDCTALDGRIRKLHTHLSYIALHLHMKPDTTPLQIFERIAMATAADRAAIQARIDAIVALLEQPSVGRRLIITARRLIGLESQRGRE